MDGYRLTTEARKRLVLAGAVVEQVIVELALSRRQADEPGSTEVTASEIVEATRHLCEDTEYIVRELRRIVDNPSGDTRAA